MKRDFDLIRRMLLAVEEHDAFEGLADVDADVFNHHYLLLVNEGYVEPVSRQEMQLTWAGHDLLDAVRSEGVWAGVKSRLTAVGGSVSIEVLKQLAVQVAKEKLGLG